MQTKGLDALPPEAVNRLNPVRVQEYARATGWVHESRLGRGLTAVYQRPESRLEQIAVPLSRDVGDFTVVMATAVAVLAQWEHRPAQELLVELLLPPADILKFAESSSAAAAGDIPFEHGVALLSGARKTLLAAACSAIRPRPFHPRMSLADAEQFVRQCRLGQTERGSFVLTLACPLDAAVQRDLFDPPFSRRVTALLMRSLDRLARHLDVGDAEGALREAEDEPVVSANLCEGLLDMTPEGDGSALTVSAYWARSLPPPADFPLPGVVRLRRETFGLIETLADRLRPVPPPRRHTFVGFVDTLDGRPNVEGRREGPVFLRLVEPEGGSIRARVELNAADHHAAWEAYDRDQPVVLQGVLRRTGRTYRIDEAAGFHALAETTNPSSMEGT